MQLEIEGIYDKRQKPMRITAEFLTAVSPEWIAIHKVTIVGITRLLTADRKSSRFAPFLTEQSIQRAGKEP